MSNKIKKFRYAGIAIVAAAILALAGGNEENENTNNKIETTKEAVSVSENHAFVSVDDSVDEKSNENSDLSETKNKAQKSNKNTKTNINIDKEFDGEPYTIIDDNEPSFTKKEITSKSYESYSDLDSLGRCGIAMACVGRDIMPTEERGSIGQVKPTGWHTIKYDCVDGKYLYNRCHLIGYQLTGENANEKNLITGTRYLNVDGMLPFENMVADYVKETNNHVMYRVIPIYEGNNLLASGVEMEAYSVEDKGEGVSFHIYCYNAQPGVKIDYKNGNSSLSDKTYDSNTSNMETMTKKSTNKSDNNKKENSQLQNDKKDNNKSASTEYVLNMNSNKFHYPSCHSAKIISNANKGTFKGDRKDLIDQGYEPCKNCNP